MKNLTIYITLLTTVLFTQVSCIRSEVENSLTSEEKLKLLLLTGNDDQVIQRIVKADGNNIIISGKFQNSMTWKGKTISSSGINNSFIMKLDEEYNIVWHQVFQHGLSGLGFVQTLAIDPNNGNIFAGINFKDEASSPTTKYHSTDSNHDILLVYLSSKSGGVLWEKVITGPGKDVGTGADIDINGNVYISIAFNDSISFFSKSEASLGSDDILIIKISPYGKYQWHVTGKGAGQNKPWQVKASKSHLYVSSFFTSEVNFNGNTYTSPYGSTDGLFSKIDTNTGKTIWAIPFNEDNDSARPYATCKDHLENIYIAGIYSGSFTFKGFNISSIGSDDVFILKMNSNGNPIWLKSMGGTGSDLGLTISCDKDLGLGVSGYHASSDFSFNGENIFSSNGSNDSYLVNLTYDGKLKWGKTLGFTGNETTWGSHIPLSAGKYLVVGEITGTGSDLGRDVTTSGDDSFLIEIKK